MQPNSRSVPIIYSGRNYSVESSCINELKIESYIMVFYLCKFFAISCLLIHMETERKNVPHSAAGYSCLKPLSVYAEAI